MFFFVELVDNINCILVIYSHFFAFMGFFIHFVFRVVEYLFFSQRVTCVCHPRNDTMQFLTEPFTAGLLQG